MTPPILKRLKALKNTSLEIEEQETYVQRIDALFQGDIPLWVEREIEFPITAAYVDDLQHRLELHKGWEKELFLRRQQMLPRYRKDLPVLPPAPTHEEITNIVQQYRDKEDLFGNGLWRLFYQIFIHPPESMKNDTYQGFMYFCTVLQFLIFSFGVLFSFQDVKIITFPGILFFMLSVLIGVMGVIRKNKKALVIGLVSFIPSLLTIFIITILGISPYKAEPFLPYMLLLYLIFLVPIYTKTLFSKPMPQA